MTPGLEALRNVATLKCMLLRLPVQNVDSHGFKMDFQFCFVFFSRSIPLSLMLFMHLRSLVFDLEILGPGRGKVGGTVMRGLS